MSIVEIRHWHMCFGLGGGAKGFNAGEARVGQLEARYRCIGGVDVDPAGARDFRQLAGVEGTVLDLFSRDQYCRFWGTQPPEGWREATPEDLRRSANGERPHIVFTSMPCKAFSGLLAKSKSKTDRYVALSELTVRGVWLLLEAWGDDPPELVIFENVPLIATRGRWLLEQIVALLRSYGYAVAETTHDCGHLGGLAQSRKRFLLVARHEAKVPAFLYEPPKRPLRAVGDLLGRMPLPGDPRCGPMHRIPSLQWKTWVRLALVEAGSDWRSLNRLAVQDGYLRDLLIVPEMFRGALGVRDWNESTGAVAGESLPMNGAFSIADPRFSQSGAWNDGQAYGVRQWDSPSATVTGKLAPGSGYGSVSDPRCTGVRHNNVYRVVRWDHTSGCITGGFHPTGGGGVADPRGALDPDQLHGKYHTADWTSPARTVIAGNANGAFAVADPRSGMAEARTAYQTAGHYGVVPWDGPTGAVSAAACHDNGRWSVADPRPMPAADQKIVARIRALDGTWHRPFTTLELAVLQSLIDPEEHLELDGLSDSAWRERIGNAVPPAAAKAIASEMGRTLLLAWSGETFQLNATPVWVRQLAIAVSVSQARA